MFVERRVSMDTGSILIPSNPELIRCETLNFLIT